MRLIYISNSKIPSREANSIHVMRMCRAFAANGHQVTLLATPGEPVDDDYAYYGVDPCFEIVKCPHPKVRWVGGVLHALCAMHAVKLRPRPDLLYARYAYNLAALSYLAIPMILEVHDVPFNRRAEIQVRWVLRHRYFTRLVTISSALAEEYQRIFPELPSDKIIVAHDGADMPQVSCGFMDSPWPGRPGVLQVGYTGHLYKGRGIEVILALASAMPDVDFHIVGGTQEDITHWQTAYSGHNLFFHGYIMPSKVAQHSFHFDVLLAPYQEHVATTGGRNTVRWMSPLKLFEYMALGKAIVCSDLPVLREILKDQIHALLVPPADYNAWKRAISLLREQPTLRIALGNAAKEEFLAHYTWEKRAATVLNGIC